MKEDGVNLNNQREGNEGNKLFADDGHRITKHNQTVVEQKLVSTSFSMIDNHVQSVINKIANRETN